MIVVLAVAGVLVGIFLMGLYGDRVVGWLIFGVMAVVETAATLSMQGVRGLKPPRRENAPRVGGTRPASAGDRLR